MIKESILYIGLAQSLFASLILFTKRKSSVADIILATCLLAIAIRFFVQAMKVENVITTETDFSIFIIPLTFGPFLYLYTKYLAENKQKFETIHLLHFLPFVVVFLSYLLFFHDDISFDEVNYFQLNQYLWIRIIVGLIFFGSILIYTIFSIIKLVELKKVMNIGYNPIDKTRLNWLIFIVLFFSILFLMYFCLGLINAVNFEQRFDIIGYSQIGLTLLAFSISYYYLQQPQIFQSQESQVTDAKSNDVNGDHKIRFPQERAEELKTILLNYMEEKKPFLNTELTLEELSSKINVSKYDLTFLLNNYIGKNFFTFINEYRLRTTIEKLESKEYDHLTIISIAYDSGFNSKSTFNNLFKQHTGLTPSQYKTKRNG